MKGDDALVRWMHLSDLNLNGEGPLSYDVALSRLVETIASGPLSTAPLDFIFCTGDIAYSGKASEYAVATEFFHRLSEAARVPLDRIVTVPGNHDIDRERLRRTFRLELQDEDSSELFFRSGEDLAIALRPLHNYVEHDRQLFGREWSAKTPYTHTCYKLRRLTISVIGLNTTWLAPSDDSPGSSVVGHSLLQRALADARQDEADLVLVLMHHPVDWLAPFERDPVRRLLSHHADFVLHGHIDDPAGYEVGSAPGGTAFLGAGSWSRRPENRRAFLVVDAAATEVRVQPYLYGASAAGRWWPSEPTTAMTIARSRRRRQLPSRVTERNSPIDLEQYAQALRREHGYFPIGGQVLARHAPATRIEDAYVAPRLQPQLRVSADSVRAASMESQDIDVLLKKSGHVVVLGEPGSGKTTLLKSYLLGATRNLLSTDLESEPYGRTVPIFFSLRDFGHLVRGASEASWHQVQQLVGQALEPYGATPAWIKSALAEGRLILLFDGVDELPSHQTRATALRAVGDFAARWPEVRIVITSRPVGFRAPELGRLEEFLVCHLRPFSQDQVHSFLQRIFASMVLDTARSQELAQDLFRTIQGNASLAAMASSPLMLWAIALMYLNIGQLPTRRVDLYRSVIETLVGRWDRAKGLVPTTSFGRMPTRQRLAILESLALFVHQQGPGPSDFTVSALDVALTGFASDTAVSGAERSSFLDELVERTGLIVRTATDSVRFLHMSFQEYLAARAILNSHEHPDDLLGMHMANPWWREVLLLTLAEAQSHSSALRDRLFRRLTDRVEADAEPQRRADAFGVLASAAVEAMDPVDRSAYLSKDRRLVEAALQIVEDPGQPGSQWTRVQLARLLGKVGDPRLGLNDDSLFVAVPAGPFMMGAGESAASEDERPQHIVFVSTFLMGRFPVTNVEFVEFVEAGGYVQEKYWAGGFGRRTDVDSFARCLREAPNAPVTGISWFEAEAFCRWLNAARPRRDGLRWRLPTEAEWEKAARGGGQLSTDSANPFVQRRYPWGNEWTAGRANAAGASDAPTPVGLYPSGAGPYGTLDQAGNVGEWCQDGYWMYGGATRSDPLGMTSSAVRAVRGGDWTSSAREIRVSSRCWRAPSETQATVGFRLAASGMVPVPARPPNPFTPGIALPSDAPPPGRMAVISALTGRVSDGGSCTLLGPRRSGKTSILRYLRTVLSDRHTVRFLDLQGHPCRTPDVLAAGLEESLGTHHQPARELQRMLAAEPSPVILLDELGRLRNADAEADPNIFEWLRALGQEGVALVLAGTDGDWDSAQAKDAEKPGSSFANIMKPFRLGPLSHNEAIAFLLDTAPDDVPIDPSRVGAWMVDLTGGWPFYLQILGHAYVEEQRASRGDYAPQRSEVQSLYERALLHDYDFVFRQRWREMHERTRAILLRAAAERLPDPATLSPGDIEHLELQGVFDLRRGWLIEQDRPFVDWMHAHLPSLQAKDEELE